jgi:para-nitrobenzyl esterase
MKQLYFAVVGVLLAPALLAQDCANGRYTDPNFFQDVTVTSAVVFGSNTGVSGGTTTLRMDIYEPTGDALSERPVVLVAFGGSFVAGSRADVAPICQAFARMGYVAVAPDYRVGFFLPNQTTTTRAVMRGAHDMRAAVRYLRRTVVEDGNPYGLDTSRIIIGGVSAGAISAIHATYLDQESEIPAVLQGEIASLGGVEGNSGNPGFSSEVFACYSFSGAIGDTLWIEPNDKPLVSVHETGDNVVPYYTQEVSVLGIPTGLIASGSHDIHVRAENMGMDNCLKSYTANAHVGYIQSDFNNSVGFVALFISELVCGETVTCGLSTNVAELVQPQGIQVFPNPTEGLVTLELPEATRISVLDMSGREVMFQRHPAGTVRMDLGALPNGIYLVRTEGAMPQVARIVKAG